MTNTGSTSFRPHWTLAVADTEIASIGSTNTALTTYVGGIQRMLINALGGTLLSPGTGAGAGLTVTSTNLSGATTNVGIYSNTTFGSLATTRGEGFQTILGTEAATFTLGELGHFKAVQGTIGLNSVVTNQYGFLVDSTLIGATNNFGFYSSIAAATGRFNFYANGTATNYFAGDVGIGTNSPSSKLHIAKSEATAYNGAATDGQLTAGSTVFIQQTAGTNAGVAQIVFQPRTTFPYNRIVSSGGSVPFLTFVTNNSEAMRIDSVGKVGIGTTSQNTKLEVAGTPVATSGGLITILDTSATGLNSTLGSLVWASGPGTDFYIGKKSESAIGSLSFGEANNGTEFMRLDNSGNLGIGTAAPAAKLDVTESIAGAITTALMLRNPNSTVAGTGTKIYFSSVATNNRGSYIASANTTSNNNTYLAFGTNAAGADATERMRLDSAGNLGIGTTAPGAKVTAAAANAVVASRGTAYLYTTDSVAANFGGQLSLGGSYTGTTETIFGSIAGRKENGTSGDIAGYLQFSTTNLSLGNVERMRITSAGNVGIGTTSPNLLGSGTALTVLGSTTNRGLVELGSTSVTAAGVFGQLSGYNGNLTLAAAIQFAGAGATDSGDTRFFTKPSGGAIAEQMRLDSAGNLGLGATPSAWATYKAFQIGQFSADGSGAVAFNTYYDGTNYRYVGTATAQLYSLAAGQHRWLTAPSGTAGAAITFTQAMTLNASGNLGIGTSAPVAVGAKTTVDIEGIAGGALRLSDTTASLFLDYADGIGGQLSVNAAEPMAFLTNSLERMRIDSAGNVQVQDAAIVVYAPAPAAISTTATLTNANIQAQIINTTGTTYTVTMALGTTLETLVPWASVNTGYDFTVINTASGTITMAVNTGVTALGALTIPTATSAGFRLRRTAANTFIMYRLR